jgi:hypothetical protein
MTLAADPVPTIVLREANETLYMIACQFDDLDPLTVAEANHISIDTMLFIGRQLNIP